MNRQPAESGPERRRGGLIGWLLGSSGSSQQRVDTSSAAAGEALDNPGGEPFSEADEGARAALLGRSSDAAAEDAGEIQASEEQAPQVPHDMFRVNVNLPAHLAVQEEKEVQVRITNISGTGLAFLYDSDEPLQPQGNWLDLALPNRPKPLELELLIVRARGHMGSAGQDQQIVHARFPSIRRNEQDAIIAYINNIRLYESKQFNVAAKVMLEVVTGRRRFAKFTGETIEIRPDTIRLLMDDFDAIAGAEVMLTIMAPKFSDHLDVEDVTVDSVEIVSPRKAEVEVSLAKPDDGVLLFVRKHYPGVSKRR